MPAGGGIALMTLGLGLAFFFGKDYVQPTAPRLPAIALGAWSDSPALQSALQINVLLLILGTLMDMAPLILILTPMLMPVITALGIDPVHFGMIMMLNLGIGLITPPIGTVLLVG